MTTQQSGPDSQPYGSYPAPQAPYGAQPPGVAPPGPYGQPQYSSAQAPYAQAPVPTEAPGSVTLAFTLLMGQIALSAVGLVVVIAQLLTGSTSAAFGGLSVNATSAVLGVVFAVVAFGIGNGLWALFAVKMRQGRNWARITITVLVALSIIATLLNLGAGALSALVGLVSAGLGVGAVVLMFRPETGPWFSRQ